MNEAQKVLCVSVTADGIYRFRYERGGRKLELRGEFDRIREGLDEFEKGKQLSFGERFQAEAFLGSCRREMGLRR